MDALPLRRATHISAAPEESYLLGLQLQQEGLAFNLTTVSNREEFTAALTAQPSIVIADLPLPWPGAEEEVSELQRARPDVPVVFRWGAAGSWSVEDASTQIGRSVRSALALGVDRLQSPAERRHILDEVVRYQNAHLRLGQIDTWNWEQALDQATEIMADTAAVERVSVWRLRGDERALECEALFMRATRAHVKGGELALDAAYRRAIERATFVAAHDAQHDPRTSAFAAAYLEPLGIASMLDAPIRRGGRVVGVVCLEQVGTPRQWNVVEQCAAAAFASVVARIFEVRDRRHVEEQWEESRRLEVIGRLAATVAHDFGNLATVITGFSDSLLAEGDAQDPRRAALMAIRDAGRSAADLVRHLLASTTQPSADARTIDLVATLHSALPLVQRLLGPRITVRAHLPDQPLWVHIDPSQVHRVLLNLAANSRDAMPHGGVFTLELERVAAEAGAVAAANVVRLRTTDTGQGIAADVLPHIFQPLYTTKDPGAGTGLGLSAVEAIVAHAGGTISAESRPGVATCFTVLLPAQSPPRDEVEPAKPPAEVAAVAQAAAPARALRPTTILVVDDEPALSALIRRVLERRYTIEEAETPEAALEKARQLGPALDLVVTDFTMQQMSGVELVTALRATRPHLPALIVTGRPNAPELAMAAREAHTRLVAKPFDIAALLHHVQDLLSQDVGG